MYEFSAALSGISYALSFGCIPSLVQALHTAPLDISRCSRKLYVSRGIILTITIIIGRLNSSCSSSRSPTNTEPPQPHHLDPASRHTPSPLPRQRR